MPKKQKHKQPQRFEYAMTRSLQGGSAYPIRIPIYGDSKDGSDTDSGGVPQKVEDEWKKINE